MKSHVRLSHQNQLHVFIAMNYYGLFQSLGYFTGISKVYYFFKYLAVQIPKMSSSGPGSTARVSIHIDNAVTQIALLMKTSIKKVN